MIRVYAHSSGETVELTFSGHAGFAPRGTDIVCAGVSALYETLLSALRRAGASVTANGETVTVTSPDRTARVIIDTILLGIAGIQHSYPDYVTAVDAREQTAQIFSRGGTPRESFADDAAYQRFAKRGASNAEVAARQAERDTGARDAKQTEREEVYKVYKTKEAYQKHMDEVIGNRLKENREEKERLSRLSDLTQKLMRLFGAKSEDELLARLSPAIDAAVSEQDEANNYEAFKAEVSAELRALPPEQLGDKPAEAYLEDEDFLRLIGCGLSVAEAVEVMQAADEDEAPEPAPEKSDEKPAEKPAEEAPAPTEKPARPAENALSGAGTARISKTAEHLTDAELEELVRRVARGEKIQF